MATADDHDQDAGRAASMPGYSVQQPPQGQPLELAPRPSGVNDDVGLGVVRLVGQQLVHPVLQLGRDAGEGQPGRRAGAPRRPPAPATAAAAAATRLRRPSVPPSAGSTGRRSASPVGSVRSRRPRAPRRLGQHLGVERAWSPAARRGCRRPRSGRWSSRTTRSARLIVDSRWAMIRVVRPSISTRRPAWICCSTWTSMALVASSSTRIGGLTSSVRAMAMRWRCPPERV